jgi:heme/copper-type cytochrome/quinol oxidase subunit 3
MFFFAFFWAFFHSSLAPSIQIGCMWPPAGIAAFSPWGVPLLNTVILLTSGASITVAHYGLLLQDRKLTISFFLYTVMLAVLFTGFQLYEYLNAGFSINDSVYGSTFYMSTGFHGFHVIVGTIFITVCMFRYINWHFTPARHFGFEAAAWYWHFADIVALSLYMRVYLGELSASMKLL